MSICLRNIASLFFIIIFLHLPIYGMASSEEQDSFSSDEEVKLLSHIALRNDSVHAMELLGHIYLRERGQTLQALWWFEKAAPRSTFANEAANEIIRSMKVHHKVRPVIKRICDKDCMWAFNRVVQLQVQEKFLFDTNDIVWLEPLANKTKDRNLQCLIGLLYDTEH